MASIPQEMKEEVRLFLMKYFDYYAIRDHRRMLKHIWSESGNNPRIHLYPIPFVHLYPPVLKPFEVRHYCNKTTAFYAMPPARASVGRRGSMLLPLACIFTEWFRLYNNSPNVEYGQFFAALSNLYSEESQTIDGVIETHNSLCQQMLSLLIHIRDREGLTPEEGGPWQKPGKYTITPLYRAIFVVMDTFSEPIREDENNPPAIDLSKHSQQQTILMIRGGQESQLSAPISFEELRENGDCLPLSRSDVSDPNPNVVRVTLKTAIEFMTSLERRENMVIAERPLGKYSDAAKEFADRRIRSAEEEGVYHASPVRYAIDAIVAANHCETEWSQDFLRPYEPFDKHWT